MDWGIIITAIISVLTTGGVAAFLSNPRAAKKKPEIENKNANAEADKTIVDTAKELINELKEDRKDADERYDRLEEKYDAKTKELDETNSNLVMCSMLICKHTACPLRDPGYGQGKDWLEKNAKEALFMGKPYSVLAFSFGPDEKNYYILDEYTFQEFLAFINNKW